MLIKKYFLLLYLIMISLDIYGQISKHYTLVWIFKALHLPFLAYYFYTCRKSKLEILDKLILLSIFIAFAGSWIAYLIIHDNLAFNILTAVTIIEGQINLFILSKISKRVNVSSKNDIWSISLTLIIAIGFIYLTFPKFATLTQILVLIAMIQLSLMCVYGFFRKEIHILISGSIATIILCNILSVVGIFLVKITYDYLWIMGLLYLSKYMFVEGILKSKKLIY